mgnify:CR=1 FL=1
MTKKIEAIFREEKLNAVKEALYEAGRLVFTPTGKVYVKKYLDEYHYGPPSWDAYLQKLGVARLNDATRRGRSIYND